MKLTLKKVGGATPISFEDAELFIGAEAIEAGERRGEVKSRGVWGIITSFKALTATATWKDVGATYKVVDEFTLHGDRTMTHPKQSGYELEGRVSIDGIKRSCFTSSMLFELPDKRLIDVALPGVIEMGLQTVDTYGPVLTDREPFVVAGCPPSWVQYRPYAIYS